MDGSGRFVISFILFIPMKFAICKSRLRSEGKDGKVIAGNLVDHFATDIEMKMWAAGVLI
jgi:hypothetical protein